MPTFACPYCGKSLQASATRERVAINCPHCTQPFEITDPSAPAYSPPPVRTSPPPSPSSPFSPSSVPSAGFTCPLCQSHEIPVTRNRTSTVGWVVLIVLCFTCLPFFWIGFFIKEDYQACRTCGKSLS